MRPSNLVLFSLLGLVWAEGTRELRAGNCANFGAIQIWDNNDPQRNFATYDCPAYARLNVRVAAGERIYMGFNVINPSNAEVGDVWFRLRAPDGTLVLGPIRLRNTMGAGWITACNRAIAGPQPLVGPAGYNPLIYTVPATGPEGDYYIEFAVNNNATQRVVRIIRWFDITVARYNGTAWVERRGRLWSKKWDFQLQGINNPFVGTLFTYSPDSVVTSFNFNGMRPYGFEVSCNSFGASNVGTPQQRRRSNYRQNILNQGGIPASPEYPIFLNDPDIEYYPTGIVGSVDSFSVIPCTEMSYCIYVSLSKAGQVQVTLNFPSPYVPWTFIGQLSAGPNCIPWDGTDGNGTPIPNRSMVTAQLNFFTGLTHLPLIDVEHHQNGFRVFLVRPLTKPNGAPISDPKIYWDDTDLADPGNSLDGVANLAGCQPTPTQGCHRWKNRGTNNANPEVINTWWYTNTEEHTFVLKIDSTQWKVFAEIQPGSCSSSEGVTIHLWFSNEIPISSVLGNITTTPAGLLGGPPDTVIDYTLQPGWVHMYLTYPVIQSGSGVVITYNLIANSSKYPYCRDTTTLSCIVLSVVWAQDLKGEVLAEYNRLSWETAQEAPGTYFLIERSEDARQFTPIGTLIGRGGGSAYYYEDRDRPLAERWFYRLQVHAPGNAITYSRTIELVAQPVLEISVDYNGNLLLSGPDRLYQVEVYDPLGRLVWAAVLGPGRHPLPLERGVYLVRVEDKVVRFIR